MKVHYPKLYNLAHPSLNVFTACKRSNNYILFSNNKSKTWLGRVFLTARLGRGFHIPPSLQLDLALSVWDLVEPNRLDVMREIVKARLLFKVDI